MTTSEAEFGTVAVMVVQGSVKHGALYQAFLATILDVVIAFGSPHRL
jgi:hypothetical protein